MCASSSDKDSLCAWYSRITHTQNTRATYAPHTQTHTHTHTHTQHTHKATHLNSDGLIQVDLRKDLNLFRHGGTEKEGLVPLRKFRHNVFDLRTHVCVCELCVFACVHVCACVCVCVCVCVLMCACVCSLDITSLICARTCVCCVCLHVCMCVCV